MAAVKKKQDGAAAIEETESRAGHGGLDGAILILEAPGEKRHGRRRQRYQVMAGAHGQKKWRDMIPP